MNFIFWWQKQYFTHSLRSFVNKNHFVNFTGATFVNHLHRQTAKPSSPNLDCIKFSEEIGQINRIVEL